jgi:hypothetical protein
MTFNGTVAKTDDDWIDGQGFDHWPIKQQVFNSCEYDCMRIIVEVVKVADVVMTDLNERSSEVIWHY